LSTSTLILKAHNSQQDDKEAAQRLFDEVHRPTINGEDDERTEDHRPLPDLQILTATFKGRLLSSQDNEGSRHGESYRGEEWTLVKLSSGGAYEKSSSGARKYALHARPMQVADRDRITDSPLAAAQRLTKDFAAGNIRIDGVTLPSRVKQQGFSARLEQHGDPSLVKQSSALLCLLHDLHVTSQRQPARNYDDIKRPERVFQEVYSSVGDADDASSHSSEELADLQVLTATFTERLLAEEGNNASPMRPRDGENHVLVQLQSGRVFRRSSSGARVYVTYDRPLLSGPISQDPLLATTRLMKNFASGDTVVSEVTVPSWAKEEGFPATMDTHVGPSMAKKSITLVRLLQDLHFHPAAPMIAEYWLQQRADLRL
jgi:hypothetical protein